MIQFVNILFLAYVILWPIFTASIFQFDGAGRIYMLLSALVMLVNLPNAKFWRTLKLPTCFTWLIWIIYTIINWKIAGLPPADNLSSLSFIVVYLILPFLSMWVVAYEMQVRPKQILRTLLTLLLVYLLLGLLCVKLSPRSVNALGNGFALASLSVISITCMCYNYSLIKVKSLVIILVLSTIAIFSILTRKAFASELILLFMFYLSRNRRLNIKNIFKILVVLVVAYLSVTYILQNTMMGERFQSIEDDAEVYNTTNYGILSLLGDRAFFYIEGWELFLKSPICGIGINNFMQVAKYPMPIHSEYMVQLVENGIVGFVLYLFFVWSLFYTTNKLCDIGFRRLALGWIMSVLFISFTSWVYDMSHFYIIFGLIIGMRNHYPLEIK